MKFLETALGVDPLAINNDLEVQVGTCRVARAARKRNNFADRDLLPHGDLQGRIVVVASFQPVAVVDLDPVSGVAGKFGLHDGA